MKLKLVSFSDLNTPLAGGTVGVWLKSALCKYHQKNPGELLRYVGTVSDMARFQAVTAVGSIVDYSAWQRFGTVIRLWPTSIEPLHSIDHLQTGDMFAIFAPGGNGCRCQRLMLDVIKVDMPFWHTTSSLTHDIGSHKLTASHLQYVWFVVCGENLPIDPKTLQGDEFVQVLSHNFIGYGTVVRVEGKLVVKSFSGSPPTKIVDVQSAALFAMPSTGIITF